MTDPAGVSGPIWAVATPSTVTTMRSPAAARRTTAATLLRSSRMPTRSSIDDKV